MSIQSIGSRDNPQYKQLRLLAASGQARRKAQRSLLEGVHLCQAWLQQRGAPLLCVHSVGSQGNPEVAAIVADCMRLQTKVLLLPDAMYQALSQVAQGVEILFVIDTPAPVAAERLDHAAVLLDGLQDPGTLGSILRSAAAAGIDAVYCSPGCVAAWSPKVLRAGMGAHFLLRIHENCDLAALLRTAQLPVVATSSHAGQDLYDLDLTQAVAWMFGHEGQGVGRELLEMATHRIAIPHLGMVESLNVAASAAVCFFEQVRQKLAR